MGNHFCKYSICDKPEKDVNIEELLKKKEFNKADEKLLEYLTENLILKQEIIKFKKIIGNQINTSDRKTVDDHRLTFKDFNAENKYMPISYEYKPHGSKLKSNTHLSYFPKSNLKSNKSILNSEENRSLKDNDNKTNNNISEINITCRSNKKRKSHFGSEYDKDMLDITNKNPYDFKQISDPEDTSFIFYNKSPEFEAKKIESSVDITKGNFIIKVSFLFIFYRNSTFRKLSITRIL